MRKKSKLDFMDLLAKCSLEEFLGILKILCIPIRDNVNSSLDLRDFDDVFKEAVLKYGTLPKKVQEQIYNLLQESLYGKA